MERKEICEKKKFQKENEKYKKCPTFLKNNLQNVNDEDNNIKKFKITLLHCLQYHA